MFGRKAEPRITDTIDISSGSFDQEVKGGLDHQDPLRRLAGGVSRRKIPVRLVPEPASTDASRAVKVVATHGEATIGYLPSEVASEYQPVIMRMRAKRSRSVTCRAFLVTDEANPEKVDAWLDCDLDKLREAA